MLMQLLIATHNGLFYLDLNNNFCGCLAEGYFYGIAILPDGFLAAERYDPNSKSSSTTFHHYASDGTPKLSTLNGADIIDIHQITSDVSGLYICNSGRGILHYIPHDNTPESHIAFTTGSNYESVINSVHASGENIYVVKHNRAKNPSDIVWIKRREDSWTFCTTYQTPHYGIHNVIPENDYFYYNASDAGEIVKLHTNTYDTEDWSKKGTIRIENIQLGKEFHPKGMDLKGDKLVVGISDNGELKTRFNSKSSIAIIDTSTFKVIHLFKPTNPTGKAFGNINEIRII